MERHFTSTNDLKTIYKYAGLFTHILLGGERVRCGQKVPVLISKLIFHLIAMKLSDAL